MSQSDFEKELAEILKITYENPPKWNLVELIKTYEAKKHVRAGQLVTADTVSVLPGIMGMSVDDIVKDFQS